ncbi:hypothetical protein ACP70R_044623 [Stipagrostis hirtigluma subsp. patula]
MVMASSRLPPGSGYDSVASLDLDFGYVRGGAAAAAAASAVSLGHLRLPSSG